VSFRGSEAPEKECFFSFLSPKEVGLAAHGVPQLHMIVICVSSHNVGCLSLWVAEPKANIRLNMLPVLFIINIVEVVAEEDGVLLAVTST
jgi:hypothetical protein